MNDTTRYLPGGTFSNAKLPQSSVRVVRTSSGCSGSGGSGNNFTTALGTGARGGSWSLTTPSTLAVPELASVWIIRLAPADDPVATAKRISPLTSTIQNSFMTYSR